MSYSSSELVLPYGRDLVGHDLRRLLQAIGRARLDRNSKHRQIGRIGSEAADSYGFERLEMLVLNDDDRARFAGIVASGRACPDFASLQSLPRSDIASTQA